MATSAYNTSIGHIGHTAYPSGEFWVQEDTCLKAIK